MLCQKCHSRVDCSALCAEAEKYVSQDVRYQREQPISRARLGLLDEKISWEEWAASQRDRVIEWDFPAIDLSCLSLRQRQCLELHYFKGLPLERVAIRLSLSRSTVQVYVKRGLLKLGCRTILHLVKGKDDQCAKRTRRACQ